MFSLDVPSKSTRPMSAAKERMSLFAHGTRPSELSAHAIYCAAVADIRHKAANVERKELIADLREKMWGEDKIREEVGAAWRFAFLSCHVKDSGAPTDLIALAIRDIAAAAATSSVQTAMIYESVEKLRAALEIARQQAAVQ